MKIPIPYLFIILLVFPVSGINAQRAPESVPAGYFEHIALHTDRDIYITGEKVWFKATCTEHSGNTDSLLSRILYVEIYDPQHNPVARSKFMIQNGSATGHIVIPPDLLTGYYFIRAYSQFLRNFPSWIFPAKVLTLINPDSPSVEQPDTIPDEVMIFPEGGKLLAGVTSSIALEINPQLIENIQSALVKDDNGNVITGVDFLPNGLALIKFTPRSENKYKLQVINKNGQIIQKPFPVVYNQGILLTASCDRYNLNINLHQRKIGTPADISDEYIVDIRSPQFNLLMSRPVIPGKATDIQLEKVPHVLVYLVLKDHSNKIISIQAVYLPQRNYRKMVVETAKSVYKPREYIDIKIDRPPGFKAGTPILTVVPEPFPARPELLSIQAAGNPGLLLNMLNNVDLTDSTIVMQINALLQLGYPAYNAPGFKAAIEQKPVLEWLPEIRDAGISGCVVDKKSKRPLPDVMVYAAAINGNQQVHIYKTKADGKFYFTLNHLAQMHHLFIGPKPVDTLDMEVMINSDFANSYPPVQFQYFYIDSIMREQIDKLYRNNQVGKTFQQFAERTLEKPDFQPLPDRVPSHSVILSDYIEMPVMQEVFSEIVPFTTIHQKDKRYALNLYDNVAFTTLTDPLVLLDGIPVFDLNKLMEITPDQVEKIGIINKQVFLGEYTLAGIIDIKTKTRNFAGISFPETSEFIEYQAVSPTTIPVFPVHNAAGLTNRIPDFRNLLYWNSFVGDEKNDTAFYAPDNYGLYKVIFSAYDGETRYYGSSLFRIER